MYKFNAINFLIHFTIVVLPRIIRLHVDYWRIILFTKFRSILIKFLLTMIMHQPTTPIISYPTRSHTRKFSVLWVAKQRFSLWDSISEQNNLEEFIPYWSYRWLNQQPLHPAPTVQTIGRTTEVFNVLFTWSYIILKYIITCRRIRLNEVSLDNMLSLVTIAMHSLFALRIINNTMENYSFL